MPTKGAWSARLMNCCCVEVMLKFISLHIFVIQKQINSKIYIISSLFPDKFLVKFLRVPFSSF